MWWSGKVTAEAGVIRQRVVDGITSLLHTGAAGHALMRMALRRFVRNTGGAGGVVLSNEGWVRVLESQ